MGMTAFGGISIVSGGLASFVSGALVFVCAAACFKISSTSTKGNDDDMEACQSVDWANKNKTTTLQAKISLQDAIHQLELFAAFWNGHIQDLYCNIKMLQTLKDKSVLIIILDVEQIKIATLGCMDSVSR